MDRFIEVAAPLEEEQPANLKSSMDRFIDGKTGSTALLTNI